MHETQDHSSRNAWVRRTYDGAKVNVDTLPKSRQRAREGNQGILHFHFLLTKATNEQARLQVK